MKRCALLLLLLIPAITLAAGAPSIPSPTFKNPAASLELDKQIISKELQQTTNHHLSKISAENAAMQDQAKALNTELQTVVAELKKRQTALQNKIHYYEQVERAHVINHKAAMQELKLGGILIVLGIMIITWLFTSQMRAHRRRAPVQAPPTQPHRPSPPPSQPASDIKPPTFGGEDIEDIDLPKSTDAEFEPDEGEFDYLNSVESLPAKIDLARAYIQMEDFAAARELLQDVIKHGDNEQRRQAQAILATL